MFDSQVISMLLEGIRDTLYMTIVSTLVAYVLGLPLGICLKVTSKDGLKPNKAVYALLDFICNIVRSIPFLILLILKVIHHFLLTHNCLKPFQFCANRKST